MAAADQERQRHQAEPDPGIQGFHYLEKRGNRINNSYKVAILGGMSLCDCKPAAGDRDGAARRPWVVLLAEDDENGEILIRRATRDLPGVGRLVIVQDGAEAVNYLVGVNNYADRSVYPFPDVALLDKVMPRLSGLETLCWLRSEPRFERLPVGVFSGWFSPEHKEMVKRLNAVWKIHSSRFAEMPSAIEEVIHSAIRVVRQIPAKHRLRLRAEYEIYCK